MEELESSVSLGRRSSRSRIGSSAINPVPFPIELGSGLHPSSLELSLSTLHTLFGAAAVAMVLAGRVIVISGDTPGVELPNRARVKSLEFPADLAVAVEVTAGRLRLDRDARVAYEKNGATVNQTVAADLELAGAATFSNDNAWTHDAHMLRFPGTISGRGPLTIDGTSDGGIELSGDNGKFGGTIQVVAGRLVVRSALALGAPDAATVLGGGTVWIPSGVIEEPFLFEGDATISLGGGVNLRGDITVDAGTSATLDTGGGNQGRLSGRLTGKGNLVIRAGGAQLAHVPLVLGGDRPTDLAGRVTVLRGTLALDKPDRTDAVAGELVIGGGESVAVVRLDASQQIADDARVSLAGSQPAELFINGHEETLGPLLVETEGVIRMGPGADIVRFAASREEPWPPRASLIVEGWEGNPKGGGEDQLVFAGGARGLRPVQVSAVGFRDPAGRAPGIHTARLLSTGELVPDGPIVPATNNAFAIDAITDAARAELFAKGALAALTGAPTPLPPESRLAFFGDSITWQHGFLTKIEEALATGAGTKAHGITVINRGINGGGVRDLRDGSPGNARAGGRPGGDGNAPQATFNALLEEDRPTLVVIFIGVNDVNWKGTTPLEFEEALRDLVAAARARDARVVLATPWLDGERPDGSNHNDAALNAFSDLTRAVAAETGATLVDLRASSIAWLKNHNRRLRLDGTLEFEDFGLLTYDRIHPTDEGNARLADLMADGLQRVFGGEAARRSR